MQWTKHEIGKGMPLASSWNLFSPTRHTHARACLFWSRCRSYFSSRSTAVVISSVSFLFFKFRWSRCRFSSVCFNRIISFTGDSYTNRFVAYHSFPSYAFNVLIICSVRVHSFHSVGHCIFPPLSQPKCLCVVQKQYFLELITNHKYLNCFGVVFPFWFLFCLRSVRSLPWCLVYFRIWNALRELKWP